MKDICQDGISEMRPQTFLPRPNVYSKTSVITSFSPPHYSSLRHPNWPGTNLTSLSFSRLRDTELEVISPPEISKGSVRHFRNRVTQETRRPRPPCRRVSPPTQVQRPPSVQSLPTCGEEPPPIPTSTTARSTTGTTTAPATRRGCPVSVDVQVARTR